MIEILSFSEQSLLNPKSNVSVSIVDTGFSVIPKYAQVHSKNAEAYHFHGNRVLSVFSALDNRYPIPGLKLHLLPVGSSPSYDDLIYSISLLPHTDILSLSMCWRDNNAELISLISSKANIVVAPCANGDLAYPANASLANMVVCCDDVKKQADYCLKPRSNFNGSSYSTPAIARLMCYDGDFVSSINAIDGVETQKLFSPISTLNSQQQVVRCSFCKRVLRSSSGTLMQDIPDNCIYCGMPLFNKKAVE